MCKGRTTFSNFTKIFPLTLRQQNLRDHSSTVSDAEHSSEADSSAGIFRLLRKIQASVPVFIYFYGHLKEHLWQN